MSDPDDELTEDALARRVYHLNTLHELNQEISSLRKVNAVLKTSLLYIIGVFGLQRGLIALYKDGETQPCEFVYQGIHKNTAARWFQQLEEHLKESYINKNFVVHDTESSPLIDLLSDYSFRVWLPFRVNEQIWGTVTLGMKLSEIEFTADDLELLSTITINIQNFLANVSLIESLNQAVIRETRIRNVFQRYVPEAVVNEVLNPFNEKLLLGESESVRYMFDQMITRLEEQHILEQDLDLAHQVQEYLLPSEAPRIPGIDIAARSVPARGVCGDFYDFVQLSNDEVGLSLADISGKGMSAAIISAMLQAAIRMCMGSYYPVPAILSILNRFMFRHTESARYATIFYGQINVIERTFTYSNAGHPPAMLYRDGKIHLLETGGPMIGIFEHYSFEQDIFRLQSKDALIIYSDGVTDAGIDPESDDPGNGFSQERLESALIANALLPANALLNAITDEVTSFVGKNKQFDDITLIIVKVE